MPSREQMIAEIRAARKLESTKPSREQMIAEIRAAATQGQERPGVLDRAKEGLLSGVGAVGEALDKYGGGASIRSAIGTLQKGGDIRSAVTAAKEQYGEDPRKAPTGQEIVERAGVPRTALSDVLPSIYSETGEGLKLKRGGFLDPTASGSAGLVLGAATDPLSYVPVGKIAQAGLKGVKSGVGAISKAISPAAKKAEDFAIAAVAKTGSTFTGLGDKQFKTYINRNKEVKGLINKYGDDLSSMTDDQRSRYMQAIQSRKSELNEQIGKALSSADPVKTIDVGPVIDRLNAQKSRLNPKLYPDQIAEIDEIASKVSSLSENGLVSSRDLFEIKEFLQAQAKPAYHKGGQIFSRGDKAQRASKDAAASARKMLNEASPEIAEANNTLSLLHRAEEKVNKNLLTAGKPDAALIAAGAGSGRQRESLQKIGGLIGKDFVSPAENIAAAKAFGEAGLLPVDPTGKSLTRIAAGSALGGIIGGTPIAVVGAAMSSPIAWKKAIDAGVITRDVIRKFGGTGKNAAQKAYKFSQTKEGEKAIKAAILGSRYYKQAEEQEAYARANSPPGLLRGVAGQNE